MNWHSCGSCCWQLLSLRNAHRQLTVCMFINLCQVEVHGKRVDKSSAQTRVVKNNGFNPRWNKTLRFTVTHPQLALVMFRVLDDIPLVKDATVAQYCLPMRCLETGYRMIELRDMNGDRLGPTSLFVHITIDQADVSLLKRSVACKCFSWKRSWGW